MKRINIETVIKIIILLGFSFFFYKIIRSGNVQMYVHPRLVPYIKFAIISMVSISIFMLTDIFKSVKRKTNLSTYTAYLLFIIPLTMAFTFQAKAIDSTSLAGRDINIAQQTTKSPQNDKVNSSQSTGSNNNLNIAITNNQQNIISPVPIQTLQMEGDTVVIEDTNFISWLTELSDNLAKYEGKKIQVTGFVYKEKNFKENEFVVARLMMTCCTADVQVVGLMCNSEKVSSYKNDTWVKVTGRLKKSTYDGQSVNVIVPDTIEKANKPDNEYVYPY